MMDGLISWSPGVTLDAVEKQVILAAFKHYRGNKTVTANALGIAVRTLDYKLEHYEKEKEKEKADNERDRQRRVEELARARGIVGQVSPEPGIPGRTIPIEKRSEEGNVSADAGIRVESTFEIGTEQAVPLPQRAQVQTVLPKHATQSHTRKAR